MNNIKSDEKENKDNIKNDVYWQWKPKKWWLTLISFWFISLLGSFNVDKSIGGGFIIFMMIIIVIYSVIDDIRWNKKREKIMWVVGMWVFHGAILMPLSTYFFFLINYKYFDGQLGKEIFRLTYIINATPIIIWSMKKSKKFVKKYNKN
jgi:hypothetical protein